MHISEKYIELFPMDFPVLHFEGAIGNSWESNSTSDFEVRKSETNQTRLESMFPSKQTVPQFSFRFPEKSVNTKNKNSAAATVPSG